MTNHPVTDESSRGAIPDADAGAPRVGEAPAIHKSRGAGPTELHGVSFDPAALAGICRRHSISRLLLYGSILRDDFGPDSDVDMLAEFEPGRTPGFAFIDIQEELSALFGRAVDLGTPAGLSRYFRDRVLREAESIYVSG